MKKIIGYLIYYAMYVIVSGLVVWAVDDFGFIDSMYAGFLMSSIFAVVFGVGVLLLSLGHYLVDESLRDIREAERELNEMSDKLMDISYRIQMNQIKEMINENMDKEH
jgi:hypothetical protein